MNINEGNSFKIYGDDDKFQGTWLIGCFKGSNLLAIAHYRDTMEYPVTNQYVGTSSDFQRFSELVISSGADDMLLLTSCISGNSPGLKA